MSDLVPDPNQPCESCGRFGAFVFGDVRICAECYQERGSCCAERPEPATASAPACEQRIHRDLDLGGDGADETFRLSSKCCYEGCAGCASFLRLREFQFRHLHDWRSRLRGPRRLLDAVGARD